MTNDNSPPTNKVTLDCTKDVLGVSVRKTIEDTLGVALINELSINQEWHGLIDIDDPSQGYFCDIKKITEIVIDNLIEQCFEATYIAIA